MRRGFASRHPVAVSTTTWATPALDIPRAVETRLDELGAGEVGWVTASIKDVHGAPVGDTLTLNSDPAPGPLPGFQKMQSRVFAGLFPVVADDYPALREALDKLKLNDAALNFEPESSEAMGFGFRCLSS